jgi:hypothetical protein
MAAPRTGRRQRDAPLGQIPLSSGEIELYSRQDEAARRRRRLLAVRDQERRLAQQVTQRYRSNLQKLQRGKSDRAQQQLSDEQRKLLTELHRRYQSSLQSMGTAQRNARSKLLELMEQAQQEQHKWNYNRQVAGHQRAAEAIEEQEQDEADRTARRRQVEQNMQRLKMLSGQQREHASSRARQEHEVAKQRAKDREEIDKLRRLQSPEEVFVTPRPHKKDVQAYQFTRTHCVPPAPVVATERPAVTVIRHNRKHPTAVRGDEDAKEFSEQVDQKRERDRLVVEEQGETAAQRGKSALDEVTSRKQGQQALEWLALVDKMERRTRGQEAGGGEDYPLDATAMDRGSDDPERMAERAFARMLGLDEDSIELSAFSIDTDDEQSVGLADTDHEHSDGDKIEGAEMEKVELKATKDDDLLESLDSGRLKRAGKGEQDAVATGKLEKPFKRASDADLEQEKLNQRKKANDARQKSVSSEGMEASSSGIRSRGHEDNAGQIEKSPEGNGTATGVAVSPNVPHLQWSKHAKSGARSSARDERQRRDTHGDAEERPEGTDSEDGEMSPGTRRLGRNNDSIERLESRLQEVLDLRLPRPQQGRSHEDDGESLSSASEAGQRVSQLGEATRRNTTSPRTHMFPSANDGADLASGASLYAASSELDFSRSAGSEMAASGGHHSVSSSSERSMAYGDEQHPGEQLLGSRQGSKTSSRREELHADRRASMRDSSLSNPGGDFDTRPHMVALRSGGASNAMGELGNAGNDGLDSSVGSFTSSCRSGHGGGEVRYDESGASVGHGAKHPPRQSVQESAPEESGSGHGSITKRAQALLDERDGRLSSRSSASNDEDFEEARRVLNVGNSRGVSVDEDQRSVSESSFAPSQKSLSRLDQVANERAKSLGQRFIDEHMSSSSSEGHSDVDEDEGHSNIRRPSVSSGEAQPTVHVNPLDQYRRQMDRRSSSSVVSVAQYSLPPSDTQSSFDDSLDRLHPGYGDDSFVNDLVPMFPRRALPPPPQSFEEALEEYDVQLVAPNVSRMLTSERRTSFGRSRQRLVHQERPHAGATEHSQPHSASGVARRGNLGHFDEEALSSSSRRSSSGSSSDDMDSRSVDSSVREMPRRQQAETTQSHGMPVPSRDVARQHIQRGQERTFQRDGADDRSDISSDSGVSSLGFAVQLNLAAGTSRKRNADGRRDASRHADSRQNTRAQEHASDDELENQSLASDRSFASSSSLSLDAHFNYLVDMTSAVGKSLPLHLRLPASIYGKKDMTKPPAPMTWSASSRSSVASVGEVDPDEDPEGVFRAVGRSIPRSNSSRSDSLLEEQHLSPPRPVNIPPMQKFDRSLDDSQASSEQLSEDFQVSMRRLPPRPVGPLDMSQPPPPMQNFRRSLAASQSSSEPRSEDVQGPKKRDVRFRGAEDERKHDDSSSASLHSDGSSSSSSARSRRQSVKKAEQLVIPVKKSDDNNADDQRAEGMSLAEAFQRRHPGFGRRMESHRDKLKRQRDKQQQEQQQPWEPPRNAVAERDTEEADDAASHGDGRSAAELPPEKQEVLDRLASGSRAKISSREMKERSRRLYHRLPEVVERKRQEEVMRRRRERLDELRQQEKVRPTT